MTPIERVARQLCEIAGRDPDEVCVGEGKAIGQTWLGWEAFASDARKVIAAMREPDETMLKGGEEMMDEYAPGTPVDLIWKSMIDAALNEVTKR